jgi:hypothetical protein
VPAGDGWVREVKHGVLEIVEDFDGDTWRAVYTVECSTSSTRKRKKAISAPKHIIEWIK